MPVEHVLKIHYQYVEKTIKIYYNDEENSQCMALDSLEGINLEIQQAETERLEI